MDQNKTVQCKICKQFMPGYMSFAHFLIHFPYLMEIYRANFSDEDLIKYMNEK
jgi:hypothetical protein